MKPHEHLQNLHDQSLRHGRWGRTQVRHKDRIIDFGIAGVKTFAAGATITTVTQVDPTDGGAYQDGGLCPVFGATGPVPEDINQFALADCWMEAVMLGLATFDAGKSLLKRILQPATDSKGVRIPGKFLCFFERQGVWTGVLMDMAFAQQQNQVGPSGNIWGALIEKAAAFYRTGADQFHSLDYGYPGNFMSDLGQTGIGQIGNMAKAQAAIAAQGSVALTTPGGTVRSDMVPSHCYAVLANSLANPWGENSGSMARYPVVTDSDLATYLYTLTGFSPVVVPTALPVPVAENSPVPNAPILAVPAPAAVQASWHPEWGNDMQVSWINQNAVAISNLIERSPDGVNWTAINTVSGDKSKYDDHLAALGQYYYRVTVNTSNGSAVSAAYKAPLAGPSPAPSPSPVPSVPYTGTLADAVAKNLSVVNGLVMAS